MVSTADYIKCIGSITACHDIRDVFTDVCRMYAISLYSPFVTSDDYKAELEGEFARCREKYGEHGYENITLSFAMLVDALSNRRADFLGKVLEELNCNKKGFGQFLTPASVACLMAHVTSPGLENHAKGEIIRINDPACGAGVLLIEQAEEMVRSGVPQSDILVMAEDLDGLSCSIVFTQLSLLGYAGIVTHRDSMAMRNIEPSWYTVGYFLHGIPMRTFGHQLKQS